MIYEDWFEQNPNSEECPEFIYPIEITLDDGTIETINSEEELDEVFEDCYGDGFGGDSEEFLMDDKRASSKSVLKRVKAD